MAGKKKKKVVPEPELVTVAPPVVQNDQFPAKSPRQQFKEEM
jgi:hypothetical protein